MNSGHKTRLELCEDLVVEKMLEISRLTKAVDALCLRCGTSEGMCPPGRRVVDGEGACSRSDTCVECWNAWALECVGGRGDTMTDPCPCCAHVDSCGVEAPCLECPWAFTDRFAPSGDCATCRWDPRRNWICSRCVDHDQWTDGKANTCTLCRGARYVDGVGGANGRHPCPVCAQGQGRVT